MRSKAELLGLERLYDDSEGFRERFDEMYGAVEQLPEHLIERGREYLYPQLHNACVSADFAVVDGLLKAGIPADAYTYMDNGEDEPPLVWLAWDQEMDPADKLQVAMLLLGNGADINEGCALRVAEEFGDEAFALFLRERGAEESDD